MVEEEKKEKRNLEKENKKEESTDKEEKKDDDFFIGETKLVTSPNFKPVRNSLEKMVTKEMFEEAFPEEFKREDEEDVEEVYPPKDEEDNYNEVREEEEESSIELTNSEFYKDKNDGLYSEDNAKRDKYAVNIMSGESKNEDARDKYKFDSGISEEIRQSRKSKASLN
ncbi:hypothetical protein GOV13_03485 [Candidatus Pacearchaeota archaeon]|nr:hypothetical protein [Candidatus Pacearchaeota archaeon]